MPEGLAPVDMQPNAALHFPGFRLVHLQAGRPTPMPKLGYRGCRL